MVELDEGFYAVKAFKGNATFVDANDICKYENGCLPVISSWDDHQRICIHGTSWLNMRYKIDRAGQQRVEVNHKFKKFGWLPPVTIANDTDDALVVVQKLVQHNCKWNAQSINGQSPFICLQYIKRNYNKKEFLKIP